MIIDDQILKDIRSIRIRAQLLNDSATRLEEKLTEGVSTPSSKSKKGLNDQQVENVIFKRKMRIKK